MRTRILGSIAALIIASAGPVYADKTAGEHIDDGTITTEVKAALLGGKDIPSTDINVESYRGHVLLSGFVTKPTQKADAARLAKDVKGVVQVHDKIAVHEATSMGTKLDDTVLVGKVKAALVDADKVEAGQINVESRGGVVQLAGFVTSDGARKKAIEVTKAISGVKRVEDAMFVKPKD
jgi:hyperosmotically inducible protein